jgi:transformation/transcription domain-associated protein
VCNQVCNQSDTPGSECNPNHRRQALSFLRTCLASVLNLSSGAARAGAGEAEIKDALQGVVAGLFGKAAEKVKEGGEGGDGVKSEGGGGAGAPRTAQLGNKTKTQLMAGLYSC